MRHVVVLAGYSVQGLHTNQPTNPHAPSILLPAHCLPAVVPLCTPPPPGCVHRIAPLPHPFVHPQGTVLELETLRLSVTERDDSTSATPSPEKDGVLQTPSPGHQDPNRTPKKAPVASASPASRRKKLRKRLQSPRISRRPWDEGQGDSTPSSGPASRLQQVLEEARKRVALQEEQAFGSQWMELEAECEQLQADREALARSHDEALERLKQREGSWMDRLRQWEQQQALSVTRHLNMGMCNGRTSFRS